jgi:uncharacterized membrane protein
MARVAERPTPAERLAKRPRVSIAGPYGHPFHPILVTVPIGAFVCSLLFDIFSHTRDSGRTFLVDGAYWLIGIGIVAALIAAVFGLLDLLTIPRHTRAFATGLTHATLNVIVLAIFAINFAWRAGDHLDLDKTRWGQMALSIGALAILVVSGWLGGKLAYRYGVRVADEQTQSEGFVRNLKDAGYSRR